MLLAGTGLTCSRLRPVFTIALLGFLLGAGNVSYADWSLTALTPIMLLLCHLAMAPQGPVNQAAL